MTKDEFYAGKRIVSVEWLLHNGDLPALTWARLRAFDDGTAEAFAGDELQPTMSSSIETLCQP